MCNLQDKVAFITGAGSGIGAATARVMCTAGAKVMLAGIPAGDCDARASELRGKGFHAVSTGCDVTDEASVKAAIDLTVQQFGQLDVVVANAGIQRHNTDRDVFSMSEDEWDRTQDVNLRGVFRTCKHALAHMLEQDSGGAFVIVSSITALTGMSPNVSYSTTKAALLGFNRHLAVHYAKRGIRANAVCPGALAQTPDWDEHPDPQGRQAAMEANIPMARLGTADDVAPTIAFLASDASAYTTGGVFVVDGGLTVG
jgi:NAD(P)-dependent dehydrogenase (short-subunit alcohol dehydrogenase family)